MKDDKNPHIDALANSGSKDSSPLHPSWTSLHELFNDAERKIHDFGVTLATASHSVEASSRLTAAEFMAFLHEGEHWLVNYISNDSSQSREDLAIQNERSSLPYDPSELKERAARLKIMVEELSKEPDAETSPSMKRFAQKCRELIVILERDAK